MFGACLETPFRVPSTHQPASRQNAAAAELEEPDMLGHHPWLERDLRKNGRSAVATLIDAKRSSIAETYGNPSIVGDTRILWKLVARVEPFGEPPFEAKLDVWFGQLSEPAVGEQYPVLYHPGDHSKVLLDRSEAAATALAGATTKDRTDERVSMMRARGMNEIADRYQAVYDAGLTTNWSNDPVKLRAQIRERKQKMREIMAGQGPDAEARLVADSMAVYGSKRDEIKQMIAGAMTGVPAAPPTREN
jgi:hypothetical protein